MFPKRRNPDELDHNDWLMIVFALAKQFFHFDYIGNYLILIDGRFLDLKTIKIVTPTPSWMKASQFNRRDNAKNEFTER